MRKIISFFLSLLVVFFAFQGYIKRNMSPVEPNQSLRTAFSVSPGERTPAVAKALEERKLIRNSNAFLLYVFLSGKRGTVKAGDYLLSPNMSGEEILTILGGKADSSQYSARFTEGWTAADMDDYLAGKKALEP